MNLIEQNEFAVELEKFLSKRLGNKPFHLIISAEASPGNGFAFPITNLKGRTPFESCNLVVSGIADETDSLVDKFEIPSDKSVKKPLQPI